MEMTAEADHRAAASRAFALSLANTVISKFGTVAIGVVLARLLGPAQFGTYAIAMVALLAVLSFNELGVSLAIVRWPSDPAEIAPTVTTISALSSSVVLVGAWIAAPHFAALMGDESATGVVRVMALCVPINGLVASAAALLQREFRQGTRLAIDQVNVWLGAVLSVGLVMLGNGAMSLAIGRVMASLASAVLFIAYSPLPLRFGWRADRVRPLLRFGLPLAGSSVVAFLVGYADQLAAGALIGGASLGLYVLAVNLAAWPANLFSQPLRGVAPPLFAKLQSDQEAMREAFLALVRITAAVVIPIVTVMGVAALPLVSVVYGSAWSAAAAVLAWLTAFAGLRIFFELVYDYLVVLGRTGPIFWVQMAWLAALIPALIVGGALAGVVGLAAAVLTEAALVVLPIYAVLLRRAGFTLSSLVSQVWLPLTSSLPLAAVLFVIRATVTAPVMALVASVCCGAGVAGLQILGSRNALRIIRGKDRERQTAQ